ncbi:metalloendoproteinase 3-MMP-like [Papaver somniferum]|uniref:metalloendoproteinase 3-MMP-like n=1 Tax=Papaver somniferum TaxID=3469 RepID=UPI000E700FF3|nr:metalloendoproteinase 3-MMP-like [Papaver somniferum]
MTVPRCGIPDIVKGKTPMKSGKEGHISGGKSSSLQTAKPFIFFPGIPKWPLSKSHLTYRFNSSILVTDTKTLKAVCSSAFARWAEVSHFTFSEAVHPHQKPDIVIGFHRGHHGDMSSFDGAGGVLAHAFSPRDGRFHYDAEENWSTYPVPGQCTMDLETVVLHEIGHLLGLGHSTEPNAVMFPSIRAGSLKRKLDVADIRGIRALYRIHP